LPWNSMDNTQWNKLGWWRQFTPYNIKNIILFLFQLCKW
jgi:hypothetical protein